MNKLLIVDIRMVKRIACTMLAALMLVAGLPLVRPVNASAEQLSDRSIQLSDSAPSGNSSVTTGVGSGNNVTYRVSFTPTRDAKSMVIDFCTDTPIIGDSNGCAAPTGMMSATTVTSVSGVVGNANWQLDPTYAGIAGGQVRLKNNGTSDPMLGGSPAGTPGTPQVFDLKGIVNPSAIGSASVGTFYARMYTYSNTSYGGYTSPTSLGTAGSAYVDYGGIALSTAALITITARVQESLTFCVATVDPTTWTGRDCSGTEVASNPPNLTIGHGTPTPVLDANTVDTATMYSQLSTNATHGAVINLHNNNACGGLSANGGTTCDIHAVTSTTAGPVIINAGDVGGSPPLGKFGLYVSDSSFNGTTGTGATVDATAEYNDHTHTTVPALPSTPANLYYGMNTTSTNTANSLPPGGYSGSTAGVNGPFGNTIASTSGPTYRSYNTYVFAATAALTTPAGIYTANMSMIATGTF